MRFLRTLLGLIRLDHHRNPDIHNRLKVDNIVKDEIVPKELAPTKAGFPVPTSWTAGYGKTDHHLVILLHL
jgi:hypothetical protein